MNPNKSSKASRILHQLTALTMICAVIIAVMYGYSSFIEEPYLYFRNLPFPVKSEVHVGGSVEVEIAHCNRSAKSKVYETTRSLRNEVTGQSEAIQSNTVSIDPGCHKAINTINAIPIGANPGKYSIWGVAILDGYSMQRKVVWYTEPFDVLPAKSVVTRGPPGPTGKAGAKGKIGPKGETGAKGAKGSFWGGK